jgi:hypothetical protein
VFISEFPFRDHGGEAFVVEEDGVFGEDLGANAVADFGPVDGVWDFDLGRERVIDVNADDHR